jgi:hypothetical protein
MSITSNHQYLLNMCIKPLYPSLVLKVIIQVCNTSLGKVTGRPIGLVFTGRRMFLEKIKSKSCRWVRWMGMPGQKGVVIAEMAYQWVPLWRVSCTCHGCKYFQAHSCLLIFIFSKMLIKGNFHGLVTSDGNVSHKHFTEMRRLARDETPFILAMPPRATTTLAW